MKNGEGTEGLLHVLSDKVGIFPAVATEKIVWA